MPWPDNQQCACLIDLDERNEVRVSEAAGCGARTCDAWERMPETLMITRSARARFRRPRHFEIFDIFEIDRFHSVSLP